MAFKAASAAFILSMLPFAIAAQDADGCSATRSSCVSGSGEWTSSGALKLRLTNNCGKRIYIKFCNERDGESPDCGASGLSAGRSTTWTTHDATGRNQWTWVGSARTSKDWVCSEKVDGWNDPMFR